MIWLRRALGWLLAMVLLAWRSTCRYRVVNDSRPAFRDAGVPYIYAILHAHQIAALCVNDERPGGISAMVSRSADGETLVPLLTARGVRAVRGSSRRGTVDKGGREALAGLRESLEARVAPLLAVDGPRGPRGGVKLGAATLVKQVEGAVVLPTMILASRRWVFARTWDRFQVPLPFSTVSLVFADPIRPEPGEDPEQLRARIETALHALEVEHEPEEAAYSKAGGEAPA